MLHCDSPLLRVMSWLRPTIVTVLAAASVAASRSVPHGDGLPRLWFFSYRDGQVIVLPYTRDQSNGYETRTVTGLAHLRMDKTQQPRIGDVIVSPSRQF